MNYNKVKERFNEYVENFDINNKMVNNKYYHSLRVSDLCEKIAASLNLDENEIALATVIGLLHDIGRFEQAKKFSTFIDAKTFDHGDFAITVLFSEGLIREFIPEDNYDEIIKKAIVCHNKKHIPEDYNEEEKLYSQIIRDADKIDILYLASIDHNIELGDTWTDEIVKRVNNHQVVDVKMVKGKIDGTILRMGLVYDINFLESLKIIAEKNYINNIVSNLKTEKEAVKKVFANITENINKYMEERLGELK